MTPEENTLLTQVGPGTPGGELLRRYWHPIMGTSALKAKQAMSVRLMGEDLVLFRDARGKLGLLEPQCAHRRVDLSTGYVDDRGLKCAYHGWTYDTTGQCVEQPGEPAGSRLKERVKIKSYVAEELGGLIFAYMGPQPAPLLPRWDFLVDEGMLRQVGHVIAPFNWLQGIENSYDAVHAELLHGQFFKHALDKRGDPTDPKYEINVAPMTRRHEEIRYDPTDYGFIRRVVLEGDGKNADMFNVGHGKVFPNITTVNGGGTCTSTFQVPVDDTHTLYLGHRAYRFPEWVTPPKQEEVPWFPIPIKDENGNWIDDDIVGQDLMVMIAQGPIHDRSKEILGTTDVGVVQYRRFLKQQIEKVQKGEEPIGVYRDPAKNQRLELPHSKNFYDRGVFGERKAFSYRRGSATGALGMQNSPINDLVEDLYEKAAREAPLIGGREAA
jgi:5,5'-dehydrodivanillate O-demethylase oxygenase subunit